MLLLLQLKKKKKTVLIYIYIVQPSLLLAILDWVWGSNCYAGTKNGSNFSSISFGIIKLEQNALPLLHIPNINKILARLHF